MHNQSKSESYAAAGVDITAGYKAVELMKKPKCENIALFQQKCYFGGGISVSFSDGSSKEPFLPGLTAYLAHCIPQVETPDYIL